MEIPLILKIKKQAHKEIARAQDIIVVELYKIFEKAVIHGGTAIWRCYNGNRFSEDIDVYIPKNEAKINKLFDNLKNKGFEILKKKIGENSLYSNLKINNINVRLEALFKKLIPKGSLMEYKEVNGNMITVFTLTPEEIIKEKVHAYTKRRKIRDLYDIFFLLRYVKNKKEIITEINYLIKNFYEPVDKKELKVLILEGIVPEPEKMIQYIKRYA